MVLSSPAARRTGVFAPARAVYSKNAHFGASCTRMALLGLRWASFCPRWFTKSLTQSVDAFEVPDLSLLSPESKNVPSQSIVGRLACAASQTEVPPPVGKYSWEP